MVPIGLVPHKASAEAMNRLPVLLWFLDAGDDETIGTLSWPASKKRQGTKSREVGHRLSSGRYEDCMSAPLSMVSATRGDVIRGTEESAVGISAGA